MEIINRRGRRWKSAPYLPRRGTDCCWKDWSIHEWVVEGWHVPRRYHCWWRVCRRLALTVAEGIHGFVGTIRWRSAECSFIRPFLHLSPVPLLGRRLAFLGRHVVPLWSSSQMLVVSIGSVLEASSRPPPLLLNLRSSSSFSKVSVWYLLIYSGYSYRSCDDGSSSPHYSLGSCESCTCWAVSRRRNSCCAWSILEGPVWRRLISWLRWSRSLMATIALLTSFQDPAWEGEYVEQLVGLFEEGGDCTGLAF